MVQQGGYFTVPRKIAGYTAEAPTLCKNNPVVRTSQQLEKTIVTTKQVIKAQTI